ncbi:class I SAM-dependent methyltransferase [Patulibacter sp. SYSU D01012]|uniref:class I SAM-dependent methyltransferase n=1 Tax=Patulibacter sp. SYSU D01012 TaxID=2817381 RepID=UPI001B3171DF|nr:class I SAM-dependent methyltransferase [Patulibacter sp. SYSU D01012]
MEPPADETRFAFGENWARFLAVLDDTRIREAERSLREMLGEDGVRGRTWLDIGSGSGLFSLAAARLGASRLHSFDYDASSVGCTDELRRRFGPADADWTVEQGSVLDRAYVDGLGRFDVVYSWGVLHHTGRMWEAFDNAARTVADGGVLFIALYNDQGARSRIWSRIKWRYNRLPPRLRLPWALTVMVPRELLSLGARTARGHPEEYLRTWTRYRSARGMSRWHDLIDWVGGYPFEVATPDEVVERGRAQGLLLERLTVRRGLGCNEFVFRRV